MDSAFRLLVYAIVAALVLFLAYRIFQPFIFPEPDSIAVIEQNLKAGETGLGLGFTSEILVKTGEGFTGETFDTRTRNVAFQCNSASVCCPREKECNLAVEWDRRRVKFNQTKMVTSTARCDLQDSLYACTVYLGERPAQVEIDSVSSGEEFDLSKGDVFFEVEFSNTGAQQAEQTEIEIEVFQKYLEEGIWRERLVENAFKKQALGKLAPGQTKKTTVSLNLNQNGQFKARVRVSGLEAGFAEKELQFSTTGASDDCMPSYCEEPRFINGRCAARCYCEKCMSGPKCADKVLEADTVDLGLHPDVSLNNAEIDILRSDMVDMRIGNRFCLSDLEIQEPNAIEGNIGFRLKNLSETPITNAFTVKAYLGTGLLKEITVQPAEINERGHVIKSVLVDLKTGIHSVDLVVNEQKTEKEKDYGNNKITLSAVIEDRYAPDPENFTKPQITGSCCEQTVSISKWDRPVDDIGAITLRQAIEQKKVRVDLRGEGIYMEARIQNIVPEDLKLRIPLGQIFVDKEISYQNLVKSHEETFTLIPMCTVWIGGLQSYCLNRSKSPPYRHYYNVGEVIQDQTLLNELKGSDQSNFWNLLDKASATPNEYGNDGVILTPVPTDLSIDLGIEQGFGEDACRAAGLIP